MLTVKGLRRLRQRRRASRKARLECLFSCLMPSSRPYSTPPTPPFPFYTVKSRSLFICIYAQPPSAYPLVDLKPAHFWRCYGARESLASCLPIVQVLVAPTALHTVLEPCARASSPAQECRRWHSIAHEARRTARGRRRVIHNLWHVFMDEKDHIGTEVKNAGDRVMRRSLPHKLTIEARTAGSFGLFTWCSVECRAHQRRDG